MGVAVVRKVFEEAVVEIAAEVPAAEVEAVEPAADSADSPSSSLGPAVPRWASPSSAARRR